MGMVYYCRIEVSEGDPAARAEALLRAKQAAAELHQLRMEEQEKVKRKPQPPKPCSSCLSSAWHKAHMLHSYAQT